MASVAPYCSGDGAFDSLVKAPSDLSACLAGYLWAALGSPEAAVRWRAAHSVRLLIELGCDSEITALNALATGDLDIAPFVDSRLAFYDLHALQWLIVAVARAAIDPNTHSTVRYFVPLLKRVVYQDRPHAVMQASAVAALSALAQSTTVELSDSEMHALQQINRPPSLVRIERRDLTALNHRLNSAEAADDEVDEAEEDEAARRMFFWDFADHWCDDVAEAFGLSKVEVLRRARRAVADRWPEWRDEHDARHDLRLFGSGKTYAHKSDGSAARIGDI